MVWATTEVLKAVSVMIVLMWPGGVTLMSVAYVTTQSHVDLCLVLSPEAMLVPKGHAADEGHVEVTGPCSHLVLCQCH